MQKKIPAIGGDEKLLPANINGGEGHHCFDCLKNDYLGHGLGRRGHMYREIFMHGAMNKSSSQKGKILLSNFFVWRLFLGC